MNNNRHPQLITGALGLITATHGLTTAPAIISAALPYILPFVENLK